MHLRIRTTLRRPLLLAMSVFVLFYPCAVSSAASAGSPVILDLGWMERQEAGIVLGLSTALRILAAFDLTVMFALTTDPQSCVRVLVQQWGLPYRVGYGAGAAYRFVSRFAAELRTIRAAHRVKGVRGGGGIGGRYERLKR